ncbi:MAG TPA: glycosyl transferase family 4 [Dokdonella sp.]
MATVDGTSADAGVGFVALLVATGALSALATWLAIRYARRRRLLDLPGQRRSHRVPTPRGGGVAIVVAMLAGGAALALATGAGGCFALLAPPVVGVAWVGWLDDHGGLSMLKRLAMHAAAALWVLAAPLAPAFGVPVPGPVGALPSAAVALVVALAIVWSINLHNFMDGIDGLLASQALFVFCALAALLAARGAGGADALLVGAAACAGFLPFNFPRARVFMGDVGSGALGFAIAVAVLWQLGTPRLAATSGLVLCSAFATDATCTLVSRIVRGRRWYSAHREHLYQWLVRCGFSHAQVVGIYMGWNLLIALPVVCWMNRAVPAAGARAPAGLGALLLVYAAAAALWWRGKRGCLRTMRSRHAA